MPYDISEFISPIYYDSTETKLVELEANTVYARRCSAWYDIQMEGNAECQSYTIAKSFNSAELPGTPAVCGRCVNTLIVKQAGTAIVVVGNQLDQILMAKLERLVHCLSNKDIASAYQLIGSISSDTKNKLAQYNLKREHKSSRTGEIVAWQL